VAVLKSPILRPILFARVLSDLALFPVVQKNCLKK
jgi:hypothetical protein